MSIAAVQSLSSERRLDVGPAVDAAADWLLSRQSQGGWWVGELEADTSLESDYILLQLWLFPPENGIWTPPTEDRIARAARYILSRQLPGGGWNIYPDGPPNVSTSVKAYLALRLSGYQADHDRLVAARREICRLGGLEATNSYAKIYLSLFGLYDRAKTPTIPPELFLLPPKAKFSIYEMSSWTRAIIAPLAILGALGSRRPVPDGIRLDELLVAFEPRQGDLFDPGNLFLLADRALKVWERMGVKQARMKAVSVTSQWMIERLEDSDGLGAIFPAMMNCIMALTELGYGPDDPLLRRQLEKFDELLIEEGEGGRATMRMQPCLSPVWDTALAVTALGFAIETPGEDAAQALRKAGDWLLSKEVRRHGDWAIKKNTTEPGGWYFEFANEFYPDTDDTAQVLMALQHTRAGDSEAQRAAERRGVNWLLSMQSRDGGWGAFDADNNNRLYTHVPFADHNAVLDPTCPDLTGRVLDALCGAGLGSRHPAVRRGIAFLKGAQEDDGSWFGRWGVNYIYGTCFALRGLAAAGEDVREAYIVRAGEWLRSVQNADGGWGESCATYEDPRYKAKGESTASQTAWALLGLMAAGDYRSGSVEQGVRYLLDAQRSDGSWEERHYTGTGFPGVFYLKYDLYRQYFPLMALAEYAKHPAGNRRF